MHERLQFKKMACRNCWYSYENFKNENELLFAGLLCLKGVVKKQPECKVLLKEECKIIFILFLLNLLSTIFFAVYLGQNKNYTNHSKELHLLERNRTTTSQWRKVNLFYKHIYNRCWPLLSYKHHDNLQ